MLYCVGASNFGKVTSRLLCTSLLTPEAEYRGLACCACCSVGLLFLVWLQIVLILNNRNYWRKSRLSAWFISEQWCLTSLLTHVSLHFCALSVLLFLIKHCFLGQSNLLLSVLLLWTGVDSLKYRAECFIWFFYHKLVAVGHLVLLDKLIQIYRTCCSLQFEYWFPLLLKEPLVYSKCDLYLLHWRWQMAKRIRLRDLVME